MRETLVGVKVGVGGEASVKRDHVILEELETFQHDQGRRKVMGVNVSSWKTL